MTALRLHRCVSCASSQNAAYRQPPSLHAKLAKSASATTSLVLRGRRPTSSDHTSIAPPHDVLLPSRPMLLQAAPCSGRAVRKRAAERRARCCATPQAAPAYEPASTRRAVLLLGTALLAAGCRPAQARGLDRYVRKPKPAPAAELLVANALLAQSVLQRLGDVLGDASVEEDAADLRALLRFGPLRACPAPTCCSAGTNTPCALRRRLPRVHAQHSAAAGRV